MPAEVQPRHGLLPGVAAFREADRPLLEAGLGRHHAVVELTAEPGCAGQDTQAIELLLGQRLGVLGRVGIEQLQSGHAVVPVRQRKLVSTRLEVALRPEHDDGGVALGLHRAVRREARAEQGPHERLFRLGLAEEEEVVVGAPPRDERGDDPRLRRQEERLAGVADGERLDVVRHHPVEVRRRVRPLHRDVRPGARSGV